MVFAKMNKAVLLTGDGKMLFRAKEVGGVGFGFNLEKCLNWIVYGLKAES